jgi:hypothetical protein
MWRSVAAYLLVLVGVAVLLVWPAPVQRSTLPGGFFLGDLLVSHWSNAALIKDVVARDVRVPLWNAAYGAGRPIAADPLAALWYPPTHLVHLFAIRDHLLLLFIGHLIFAGAGVVVIARRMLHISPVAAIIAALAFMASPRLIAHLGAGHLTMIQTIAWLPWVAVGCWATVQRPMRWAGPFAVALALMVMAGHPQLTYYGSMMVSGLAVWLLGRQWWVNGTTALLRSLAGLAVAGSVAGLLAAIHLIPLVELTAHSTRQHSVRSTDAMSLGAFLWALLGRQDPSPVPHEGMFFPGLGVLGLATIGVSARWRTGVPLLLAVGIIAALALGVTSPAYQAVAWVLPSFDGFRGLGRIWFVGLLGIACLAGLGADVVVAGMGPDARRFRMIISTIGTGTLLLSLVAYNRPYLNIQDVRDANVPSRVEQAAVELAGDGRIYGVQRNIRQAVAVTLGARLADGYDPLLIEPYVTFMQRAGGYTFDQYQLSVPPFEVYDQGYATSQDAQPDAHLLGLLNIEVVVSRTALHDARLEQVASINETRVYRNTANAGAAYMVAAGVDGAPPSIDAMQPITATIDVIEQHAERLQLRVTAPASGWLVVGAPAFPGWLAHRNGAQVPVMTVDGVLPAIWLDAGTHDVAYRYAPWSVQWGGGLTGVGLVLLGSWCVAVRRHAFAHGL